MSQGCLCLSIPPFVVQVTSSIPSVLDSIGYLYSEYTYHSAESTNFIDFYISLDKPTGLRRWYNPQVLFYFDGKTPFKPLPLSQAYPLFEWGLNWCIATHAYQYLITHSAVVEKNGKALILPGQPGAGKSTLCAALVSSGWRLLSDEMAVINILTSELIPVVRPVSLKNDSINLISQFSPKVEFGPSFLDTSKGTVAHMKAPVESVLRANETARAAWVVFPQFSLGSKANLQVVPKAETVLKLADNSFNYNVLGGTGFDTLCSLVESCDCYQFEYSQLKEAVEIFTNLAKE